MLFIAVIFALGSALQGTEAINCHMREIDLCIATIMISGADGVPANDDEMDKVCEPVQEGFECIGNYSQQCMTPLMQEVFDMVVAEPQKTQQKLCTHGSEERTKYLKNAPCLQKAMNGDTLKPHMEDMMASLEKTTEAKFQQRIPIMCCGIQRMLKASLDIVEAECGKGVLDEGGNMMGMSFSAMSDMFCRAYTADSEVCMELLPPTGSSYKGVDSDNQLIRFLSSAMANFT